MSDLPAGWSELPLAEICKVSYGKALAKEARSSTGPFHYVGSGGSIARTDDPLVRSETIVVGRKGTAGSVQRYPNGCWPSDTTFYLEVPGELDGQLIEHQLRAAQLGQHDRSTALPGLGRPDLERTGIRVPPRSEQERIVTAIEEAFSNLDAGEVALRATRQRLKRLRESVLAAAVTGRLVPQDPTDEPASKLLSRFDVKFMHQIAGGPAGWVTSEMGELASVVSGNTPKGLDDNVAASGDVPLMKVGDLAAADVYLTGSRTWVTREVQERLRLRTYPIGTIVFPKRGGAIATNRKRILGREAAFDLNTMGLVPKGDLGDWLWVWFAQLDLRKISDGSNVPQINHTDVKPLVVPVPPGAEQNRIVAEVERQFSFIDACERTVDAGLARSAALRRSILKAAFEGRLLPQDATDEPASVLLRRIRAEHDAVRKAPKPSRTSRVGSST